MVLCKLYNDHRSNVHYKQIPNTNYAINIYGEVININNSNNIKPYYDRNYRKYTLSVNNKKLKFYSHILVAKLFKPTKKQKFKYC